ncbi:hypothetical protein [Curvivirga sp.]|uniref:hypothetical protein n=1 Tax=Curvivirga sp. TaxID=2856848 RepID=UPI003B5A84BE
MDESLKFHFESIDSPIAIEYNGKLYREEEASYITQTIDIINELSLNEKIKKRFLYDGINYWQFMPSYMFTSFMLALKINDILEANKLSISNEAIHIAAENAGAFLGVIRRHWVGDIDHLRNFYLRAKTRPSIRKCPQSEVLFLTQPKNWSKEGDAEFKGVIEFFNEKGISSAILEPPYYANRVEGANWSALKALRDSRKKDVYFFDQYESLPHFIRSLIFRIKHRTKEEFKSVGRTEFLQYIFNKILLWGESILLPYEAKFLTSVGNEILRDVRPNKVCLTYEVGPYARALILAAHKEGIDTFGFMHGMKLAEPNADYSHVLQDNNHTLGFTPPTKTLVYGQFQADSLTQYGSYKEEHIEIVGNWKLKDFHTRKQKTADNIISYPVCIYDAYCQVDFFELVLSALKKYGLSKADVFVRPHPHQSISQLKRIWASFDMNEENILLKDAHDIYDVIEATDLCIHDFSSTIIEAASFGKSILFSSNSHKGNHVKLPEENKFSTQEELETLLKKYYQGSFSAKFDLEFYGCDISQRKEEIFEPIFNAVMK